MRLSCSCICLAKQLAVARRLFETFMAYPDASYLFEICVVDFQLSQLYAVYARAHKSKLKLKNS
jgi:hypothetical protein